MPYSDIEKQREFQRKAIAERRRLWLKKLFNSKCYKCGSKKQLELHHKNRKEKVSHNIWSWRVERMLEELKKCSLLCVICHKQETFKQFSHHGIARYRAGCKCVICKKAMSIANSKRIR